MTAPHADQLIEGYLARLAAAAADLPQGTRRELIDDVRSHIAEARARESEATDATILNILDRLGEPSAVVADARERLGIRIEPPYRPGFLEIAAVVLVPFFWPIGVILLWTSPAWKLRDKIIGTVFPPGGYLGTLTFGLYGAQLANHGGCVVVHDAVGNIIQNTCTAPVGSPVLATIGQTLLAVVIFLLPLITAGYLAIRLRWGRQSQPAVAQG